MLTRRRVLSILAGFAAAPACAAPVHSWQGRAMGADASIVLAQPRTGSSFTLFERVERIIAQVERTFSLHAESELARLNATGLLRNPSQAMGEMIALSARMHAATGGAFDPTIQPLWLALARGEDAAVARQLVGWEKVQATPDGIRLSPGCQLTFNGIAQGYCADRVADFLCAQGFDSVLVDTGEMHAIGPQANGMPWPVIIAGPDDVMVGRTSLANRALATSSPLALRLSNGEPHILNPAGPPPRWNTVSISAPSAAIADALSTAACLMERDNIAQALRQFPGARLEALL